MISSHLNRLTIATGSASSQMHGMRVDYMGISKRVLYPKYRTTKPGHIDGESGVSISCCLESLHVSEREVCEHTGLSSIIGATPFSLVAF
jgi:hypothetical protein